MRPRRGEFRGQIAGLAAEQLNLGEERLSGLPSRPVRPIVEGRIKFKIVVRLPLALGRMVAAVAGVITGVLKKPRHQFHPGGKVDLFLADAAAMVLGADARLVHARDERGA